MSILEKSEKIGYELKNTSTGKTAIDLYKKIQQQPQEITVELFKLINRHYTRIHFYSIEHTINVLKANTDNDMIAVIVANILKIVELNEFGKINLTLGNFVEEISKVAFGNEVKYELPKNIGFTPELVRLTNSLTVECLRSNIIQEFLAEYNSKTDYVIAAMKRFDALREQKQIVPYSKEDRADLAILKEEFKGKCSVEILYTLVSVLSFIKSMIFDAFYDNVYEVHEKLDVVSKKERKLKKSKYVRFVLKPHFKFIGPNTGWILKLYNIDGSISYGQIFSKNMKFENDTCTTTIKALIHDIL